MIQFEHELYAAACTAGGTSPNPGSEADLDDWRLSFGTYVVTRVAAGIPEPPAVELLAVATFPVVAVRRRAKIGTFA